MHHPADLDPTAALRWRLQDRTPPPWLHEEVAQRMQERLDWITVRPRHWLHWAPWTGGIVEHEPLLLRYPDAQCTVVETSPARADLVRKALLPSRLQAVPPPADAAPPTVDVTTTLPPAVDMIWANMALHGEADPRVLLATWRDALAPGGFLMFSCLGPDTLSTLRALHAERGWPPPAQEFVDLHVLGDWLVELGFTDPVVDVERITLTFPTAQRLLEELRGLGRNLHPNRFPALRGRQWRRAWLDAVSAMPLELPFEVVYGHAFRATATDQRRDGACSISLDSLRQTLPHLAGGRDDAPKR
ncbi:class I SAM-dependent methyltransferase [Candidatus Symbiobacter mobilis]|uniref:Biotin synthesis protein BioC n=1 Tax=Candidatus Symbiobacter mobilis CR TaxID=946483 RepID=U5N7B8_9BURK|nr:class I SAM-dependent methyltransferase [Candidatus Symbiobacter mobilis]AGX86188.1 biotin synthesis protein BioC [Candidatus Symbiobacter mobilis CR]